MVTLGGLIHNNNKFRFSLLLKNTNYSTCFHDRFFLNGNFTLSKHYKQRVFWFVVLYFHNFWYGFFAIAFLISFKCFDDKITLLFFTNSSVLSISSIAFLMLILYCSERGIILSFLLIFIFCSEKFIISLRHELIKITKIFFSNFFGYSIL